MESAKSSMTKWFSSLSQQQAAVVGGITGYIVGTVSGPLIRLVLTVAVLILFGFMARHVEKKFESKLGMTGVVVAILACTALGPIQRLMGSVIGGILNHTSQLSFALLGVYLTMYVHQLISAETKGPNSP
jgi:phage-related holin